MSGISQGRSVSTIAGEGYSWASVSLDRPGVSVGSFSPADLFIYNEVGAWYDPSDFSTMFQDAAGTTPVTAVNQPVGKILDKSGNGNHATMPTSQYRPQLVGTPLTYGSELLPALGASWTAEAGWTNLGVATSSNASLTTPVSLDVGSMYEFTYTVTRTGGNVYPQFTGGISSQGGLTSVSRTITQLIRAETGNTTLSITGSGSFSGTVSGLSLKKVLTWAAPYGLYGQRSTRMYSASNVSASLPCFIGALFKNEEDEMGYGILGVGNSTVNQMTVAKAAAPQRVLSYLRTVSDGLTQAACAVGEFAHPAVSFVSASFAAGTQNIKVNENAAATVVNTWDGSEALSNVEIHIGSPDGNGMSQGIFYGGVVRFAATSDAERRSLYSYMVKKAGLKFLTTVGDSTVCLYTSPEKNTAVGSLVPKTVNTTLAVAGDTIAQQKTRWLAANHDNEDVVIVQVGLNNLNNTDSAASVIAQLQDLVDTIQSTTTARVYVSTMTPERAYLITYWGGTNGPIVYQKWLDVNEAIAGGGATPITNIDGYINSHTTTLNDGSGNIQAQYHRGDDRHPNLAGRQVVADAWKAKLISDGVIS